LYICLIVANSAGKAADILHEMFARSFLELR
jgi:hypothetical protein